MRLGTVRFHGGAARFAAKVPGENYAIDVAEAAADFGLVSGGFPSSMQQYLDFGPYGKPLIKDLEEAVLARGDFASAPWAYSDDALTFLAPTPSPRQVICIGGNRKGSLTVPIMPEIQDQWPRAGYFMKATSAVTGHLATVNAWEVMRPIQTEGEVCLVIGKRAHKVSREDAWSHVAGISLLNDMFAGRFVLQDGTTLSIKRGPGEEREQLVTRQMVRSKSPDGMCPIGPWMTLPEDLTIPFKDIHVETKVGPNIVQKGNVDDYEYTAEMCIEEITKWITLEPGDVVSLGAFAHMAEFPLRAVDLAAPHNRKVSIISDELGTLEVNLDLVDEVA